MKKIPRNYQEAIFECVDQLELFPGCESLDIKVLKNHAYDFRLRVGRYRVLFDNKEEARIIAIQEVRKRDNHTY